MSIGDKTAYSAVNTYSPSFNSNKSRQRDRDLRRLMSRLMVTRAVEIVVGGIPTPSLKTVAHSVKKTETKH